jgi:NAD+ synthase
MSKHKLSLEIDTQRVRKVLTEFLRREVTRAGFQRAVVGVSGGLDSALTCWLATEALGPENVLAIRMPYKTTSSEDMEHAALIIETVGARELTVSITEMVDPLFERFAEAGKVRRGNAMARARMIVLYDQSAALEGLVIGTGNKTELWLGYSTIYGDAACAMLPLGDLYKTQVRQLARAMNIPQAVIDKPPSAGLWVGQTDEEELGFTYERVDQLLLLLVDGGYTPEACVDSGFDQAFVDAVLERIRRNHFKRVMPPIAKLSDRPDGHDFLIPKE